MHKLTFFAVQLDTYHASAITCLQHCLVLVVQTYIYLAVIGKIGNSNYQINLLCMSVFP